MFKRPKNLDTRDDVYIFTSGWYGTLHPIGFVEFLEDVKERYKSTHPNIYFAHDRDGYAVYADLSSEQLAKKRAETEKNEYECLREEFEPEEVKKEEEAAEAAEVAEEAKKLEEAKPVVSWFKKLFRR